MTTLATHLNIVSDSADAPTAPTTRSAGAGVNWVLAERLLSPSYFTVWERFLQKPLIITSTAHNLNATYNEAEVEAGLAAHQLFAVEGTNQDDAGIEFLEGGGIRIETVGADADQGILVTKPTIDTNNLQSSLTACNWDTANELLFYANILTGPDAADITNVILWAGWKLTNTPTTATDADQAFFRFAPAVNSGRWQAITSVSNSDDAHDSGVTVANATQYELLIILDSNRVPYFYINGTLVETGSAMTALATMEAFVGVQSDGAAEAKEIDIRNVMLSQLYG
jgi:hypothetical protein